MLKLIVVGEGNTGKSALIARYANNPFPHTYRPTRDADLLAKKIRLSHSLVSLQLWDTAGQAKYRDLGDAYYRGTDCCVLVYACTSRVSFEGAKQWRDDVLTMGQVRREEFPFVLVGNKADREGERQVGWSEAQTWARSNGDMPLFETSARLDSNVQAVFAEAARLALFCYRC